MIDKKKTKDPLLKEIDDLRRQIEGLKKTEAELKQAHEALKEREEQLRLVTDHMVDLVLQMDTGALFKYCTPSTTRMMGYRMEDILGKSAFDYVHPDERAAAMTAFRSVMETGHGIMEARLRHSEGHFIWIEIIGNAIFADNGEAKGIVVGGRDITRRKQIQDDLVSTSRRLGDIIDFLPDATFVIDADSRVIAWNRAIERMTGVKARHILGKGNYEYSLPFYGKRRPILIDLVLNPIEEMESQYSAMVREERILSGEAYVPALPGGSTYLFGTASALRDPKGNIVGAIESIRDITERKLAETALRESEEKYRLLAANAKDAIFIEQNGFIKFPNPKTLEMTACSVEELRSIPFTQFIHPEDRDRVSRNYLMKLKDNEISEGYSFRLISRDGKDFWVDLNAVLINWEGKPATLNFVRDLTKTKVLESQLIQAQKMEAIGTLAGGIAHDFNNILAAIIGYAEIAKGRTEQKDLHKFLDNILSACERAKNLVRQILTFSRKAEKDVKAMNMGLLVKEGLKLLRATLPSNIEIHSNNVMKTGTVLADPTQIHQVLMNLCTNAAHAMRERGGTLRVDLENVEIKSENAYRFPDLEPGLFVKLTVSDTGIGMSPDIMSRIFDPFFTTKGLGEGTGLGLSVVYGIVRECGGTVSINSAPGIGSVFTVYIPAVEKSGESKEKRDDSPSGGRERILFIDDEQALADMGQAMLEGLGYRVFSTTSSSLALKLFRSRPDRFDLIITDLTMPGMTGVDLAREFMTIRPDIPIILCTGFSELIGEEEALRMGIRDYAIKPLSMKDIARRIRKVLDSGGN